MKNFKLLLLLSLIIVTPTFCMDGVDVPVVHEAAPTDPTEPTDQELMERGGGDNDTENNYGDLDAERGVGNGSGEQPTKPNRRWWPFGRSSSSADAGPKVSTDAGTSSSIGAGSDSNQNAPTLNEAERGLELQNLNDGVFRGKTASVDSNGNVTFESKRSGWNLPRIWGDRLNDSWGGGRTRKEIYALSAKAEELEHTLKNSNLTKEQYRENLRQLNVVVKELEARRTNMQSTTEAVNDHMQTISNRLNDWGKNTVDGLKRQIKAGVEGYHAGVYDGSLSNLKSNLKTLAGKLSTYEGQSETLNGVMQGIDELKNGATDALGNLRDRVGQWGTSGAASSDKVSEFRRMHMLPDQIKEMEAQRAKQEDALAATLLSQDAPEGMIKHASMSSLRDAQEIADWEERPEIAEKLREAQKTKVTDALEDLDSRKEAFTKDAQSNSIIKSSSALTNHTNSRVNNGLSLSDQIQQLTAIQEAYAEDPPEWYTAQGENGEPSFQDRVNDWLNSLSVAKNVEDSSSEKDDVSLAMVEEKLRNGEYTTPQQKYDLLLLRKRLEGSLNNDSRFTKIQQAMDSSGYKDGTLRVDQWGDIEKQRKILEKRLQDATDQLEFQRKRRFSEETIAQSEAKVRTAQEELGNFNTRVETEGPAREQEEARQQALESARQERIRQDQENQKSWEEQQEKRHQETLRSLKEQAKKMEEAEKQRQADNAATDRITAEIKAREAASRKDLLEGLRRREARMLGKQVEPEQPVVASEEALNRDARLDRYVDRQIGDGVQPEGWKDNPEKIATDVLATVRDYAERTGVDRATDQQLLVAARELKYMADKVKLSGGGKTENARSLSQETRDALNTEFGVIKSMLKNRDLGFENSSEEVGYREQQAKVTAEREQQAAEAEERQRLAREQAAQKEKERERLANQLAGAEPWSNDQVGGDAVPDQDDSSLRSDSGSSTGSGGDSVTGQRVSPEVQADIYAMNDLEKPTEAQVRAYQRAREKMTNYVTEKKTRYRRRARTQQEFEDKYFDGLTEAQQESLRQEFGRLKNIGDQAAKQYRDQREDERLQVGGVRGTYRNVRALQNAF